MSSAFSLDANEIGYFLYTKILMDSVSIDGG